MGRSLNELKPEPALRAQAALDDMKAARLRPMVTSTGRKTLEQLAIFAQTRVKDAGPKDPGGGRRLLDALRRVAEMAPISNADFEKPKPATYADGVIERSRHQDLDAFDFVLLDEGGRAVWDVTARAEDYKRAGAILEAHGFTWGGRWPPLNSVSIGWDPFHAELRV